MEKTASTDIIYVKPTTVEDLYIVLQMERNPENAATIRQWSPDQHKAAINDKNYIHWTIHKIDNNKMIGYAILVGATNPDMGLEFKRIVIDEKGKNYGREALRLIKKIVFKDMGMHRIWLEVLPENKRAKNLYLSEGFTIEGTHRESYKGADQFYSLDVLSILKHEYMG